MAAEDDDSRVLLFSGRDVWRNGAFLHGGLLMAPGGFDQDGVLLKILLSAGLYRYDVRSPGGGRVIGAEWLAQILPGWRIKRGDAELKFFFGPDIQQHRLSHDDPSNQLNGGSFGLRMAFELWYEPTPATMAVLEASLSTIASSNALRAAFGWRVIDELFYAGPEIAHFGTDGYRHLRIGVHFTSMKIDRSEWSVAGGWAGDSDKRVSPYFRLNLLKRL